MIMATGSSGEWNVSAESVERLKQMVGQMTEITDGLAGVVSTLKENFEENEKGLGAHSDDILVLIGDMDKVAGDAAVVVSKLSFKLLKAATVRQNHINNYVYRETRGEDLASDSFITDMVGLKDTMSLGKGDSSVKQLGGIHKKVRKEDGPGYESHHIPSAAVLKQFGIDTDEWPTIALTNEDHAKTDSYRGKQRKRYKPFLPGGIVGGATYKEEAIELLDRGGGLSELVRDEIYNIREQCGDKYDGAIAQYIDQIVEYVKKHGVPSRKK